MGCGSCANENAIKSAFISYQVKKSFNLGQLGLCLLLTMIAGQKERPCAS